MEDHNYRNASTWFTQKLYFCGDHSVFRKKWWALKATYSNRQVISANRCNIFQEKAAWKKKEERTALPHRDSVVSTQEGSFLRTQERDVTYFVMNTPHWKVIWNFHFCYITAQTVTGSFESVNITFKLFQFFKKYRQNSTTVPHTP